MPIEPRRLTRIMAFFAALPGVSRETLATGLAQLRESFEKRFGADAELLMGVRRQDNPFASIGADRSIDPADAILEASFPESWPGDDIVRRLGGISDELSELVDIAKSSISVGPSLIIVEGEGDVFCGFVGRRRPDLTTEEMSRWWLERHAPLSLETTGHLVQHGYAQLHVDRALSIRAAASAGFPDVEYDMGDSLNIPDLDTFVRVLSDPEIQRVLYEDETHFLDHSSWRGVFTDKI